MDIGVGLPSMVPGFTGDNVVSWAQRAERHGFASLGVLDRLVYEGGEPLVTLAAAAAVTNRIRLVTSILVAPYRISGALLAKTAMTVDHLSGGRLSLGVASGGRRDDFDSAGARYEQRGQQLDHMLKEIIDTTSGTPKDGEPIIGPTPRARNIPLLIGGRGPHAFDRTAVFGAGWIGAGTRPDVFAPIAAQVLEAWNRHNRPDAPRLMTIGYYALGPAAEQLASDYLHRYYRFMGPGATYVAAGALTSPAAIQDAVAGLADAGCDELILFPCAPDPEQVDLLAEAVR